MSGIHSHPFYFRYQTTGYDESEHEFQFPHTVATFTPKEYGFKLGYNYIDLGTKVPTNLDLHGLLAFMPGWSSANKNFYSNTSKVLSPIHEAITANLTYIDNFNNEGFGYRENFYQYIFDPVAKIPTNIKTSDGLYTYIGEEKATAIENYSASNISSEAVTKSIVKKTITGPSTLIEDAHLFIKYTQFIDIDSLPVITIYGITADHKKTTELIRFSSSEVTQKTLNKFKVITSILSNKPLINFSIKNYFDLDHICYENKIGPRKKVTGKNGEYFIPSMTREDQDLFIFSNNNIVKTEEFRFFLDRPNITKCFVNNLLDVVVIDTSENVFIGKLFLSFVGRSQHNSTCNNNEYIFLDDEHTLPGEDITVSINANLIKAEYGESKVQVQLGDQFFKEDGTSDTNVNNWIDLVNIQHIFRLVVERVGKADYQFILRINGIKQEYSCMSYLNVVDLNSTAISGIDDLYVYNSDLLARSGANTMKLLTIRKVFSSSNSENGKVLVFPNQVDKVFL